MVPLDQRLNNLFAELDGSRVGVSCGVFPPAHGGSGLRIKRLYQRLQSRVRFRVHVFTLANRGTTPGKTTEGPFTIHRLPRHRIDCLSELIDWFGNGSFEELQWFHHVGRTRIDILTAMMAESQAIPRIHELTQARFDGIEPERIHPRGLTVKFLLYRANLTIALNPRVSQYFQRLGIDPSTIWTRPNPVDTDRFHPPENTHRSDPTIQHLVVGRMCSRKNQQLALQVLGKLPDHHRLTLVGPALADDQNYLEKLNGLTERLELEDRVRVIPEYVDEIGSHYREADSLWIPSRSEGTPNVMLEALSCGLPVFVNEVLAVGPYLNEPVDGLLVPTEPDGFAHRVEEWFSGDDPESGRRQRADQARERFGARGLDEAFLNRIARQVLPG